MNKKRVLLGMSGGVDSSVSAVLLQEQGYEVIGAFMKNWSEQEELDQGIVKEKGVTECSWRTERRDAMRVAAQLGIEFHTFDFENLYREEVYEYMIREYASGRTPNPDVLCNKYMKFGAFLEKADELDCAYVATGHYARVHRDADGKAHLLAGVDVNKDQSYFLCQLNQEQLSRALFPIGELEKFQVRALARVHNLPVADKKDSQGICFVGQVNLREFLQERIPPEKGNVILPDGSIVGQHKGHMYYTIGQRHGLGIGGGTPYFVVERRPETNEIVVVPEDDDALLYSTILVAIELTETVPGALNTKINHTIQARFRYRQSLQEVKITSIEDGVATVEFSKKQRAIAPGQFVAFYEEEELLGSGVIQSSRK